MTTQALRSITESQYPIHALHAYEEARKALQDAHEAARKARISNNKRRKEHLYAVGDGTAS